MWEATMSDDLQHLGRRQYDNLAQIVNGLVTGSATITLQLSNLVSMVTEHKTESRTFMGDTRETLAAINEQCTKTNGRVNGHDDHFAMNDREIRDIKDTLSKVLWLFLGLNVSVIGGIIVYWVTHK